MFILRRRLDIFKLDLVWTGWKVLVCAPGDDVPLEEYPAKDIETAAAKFRELEDAFNESCNAMSL
jgi:hypothetical protein